MGCDIHMVVQVRHGEKWDTALCPNLDYKEDSDCSWERDKWQARGYRERNYNLFAMLANVRNGHGFAGIVTGSGFDFISDNRGFPEDFEVDEDDDHKGVWMGDHSPTWVTLDELESFDWDKTTVLRGWINGIELKSMREKNEAFPHSWCGGVSGASIKHVEIEELSSLVETADDEVLRQTYALYEWPKSYRDCAHDFYTEFLPFLRTLGEPKDVRLVMGFDS